MLRGFEKLSLTSGQDFLSIKTLYNKDLFKLLILQRGRYCRLVDLLNNHVSNCLIIRYHTRRTSLQELCSNWLVGQS